MDKIVVLNEGVTVAGKFFPAGTPVDDVLRYEAEQSKLPKQMLTANAVIHGVLYPAGTEVAATSETIAAGYKQASREKSRTLIEQQGKIDQITLLSSASDMTAVLALTVCALITALREVQSIEEVRAAAERYASLAEKVLSPDNKFPFEIGGQDKAVGDFLKRMKLVTQAVQG